MTKRYLWKKGIGCVHAVPRFAVAQLTSRSLKPSPWRSWESSTSLCIFTRAFAKTVTARNDAAPASLARSSTARENTATLACGSLCLVFYKHCRPNKVNIIPIKLATRSYRKRLVRPLSPGPGRLRSGYRATGLWQYSIRFAPLALGGGRQITSPVTNGCVEGVYFLLCHIR